MRFSSSGIRVILAAGALVFAAAACRPNETLEAQNQDAQIKAAIKAQLASQVSAATLTAVEVNVTRGIVTLAGPVHSAAEKNQIESVVRGVKGVARVNDELQILSPQSVSPPENPATTAGAPENSPAPAIVSG
jgi:hypothetical protein